MKTVGVIAEYNPFHTGHAYHLRKAREASGADYAAVVMSPDFVQRGEPAVFDKFTRTRMALLGGADLVLELPVCYAAGSAEYFARGAVALLDSLGAVDALSFGSEAGASGQFALCARLLSEQPPAYRDTLRQLLKQGATFPQARSAALSSCTDSVSRPFLEAPNNILGIEYCRALLELQSPIVPLPVQRSGSAYHAPDLAGRYASASAIRRAVTAGGRRAGKDASPPALTEPAAGGILKYIPADCRSLFLEACRHTVLPDDLMPYLTQKLLSGDHYSRYLDVSSDLSSRISRLRFSLPGKTWSETVSALRTKQLTEARIRRALLHIILDIQSSETERFYRDSVVYYARVLGFRRTAGPLLHKIKRRSKVPLITKPASASAVLDPTGRMMWDQNLYASHLYRAVRASLYRQPFRSEYEFSPVIL